MHLLFPYHDMLSLILAATTSDCARYKSWSRLPYFSGR